MTNIIKREEQLQPVTFGNVVDQIFQNNLNRFFDESFWGSEGNFKGNRVPVNIKDAGKTYEMEMIAPGLKKQDFHMHIDGDMFTVSFELKEEEKKENRDEGWLRQEYQRQAFSRSFNLDDTIDKDKIKAKYEDGVLHVSLPKKENAQRISRTINIQ